MKTIVFCIPGNKFSNTFLKCWTLLYDNCLKNNIKPILSNDYTSNVYYVRTLCLKLSNNGGMYQKPFNGMYYDYICWIDSDMVFTWEHLKKLLDDSKDVISGIYLMENQCQYTTVLEWDLEYYKKHGKFEFLTPSAVSNLISTPIRKCCYTGLGFTLMKRGIMERVAYPPFLPYTQEYDSYHGKMIEFASEDVSLFKKLESLGIDCYVDLTVKVGHEKSIIM